MAFLLGLCVQLGLVIVAGVIFAQIMGRPIDVERSRARQCRQERRVRFRPRVAHGEVVYDRDCRELAVDTQRGRRSGRRQHGVIGDVFPIVPEILRREGFAVRPFVPWSQIKREDAAPFDVDALQDIGFELQFAVELDQARIAVDDHQPDVFRTRHQCVQHAAVAPDLAAAFLETGDVRIGRYALLDGRQLSAFHQRFEGWRFDELHRQRRPCQDGENQGKKY